eukprot:1144803-Pelagomonas_calceolata.AAC.2
MPTHEQLLHPVLKIPTSPILKMLCLKSHMHTKHRLGYANSKTGYFSYYQSLLPHLEEKISNAFRSMP